MPKALYLLALMALALAACHTNPSPPATNQPPAASIPTFRVTDPEEHALAFGAYLVLAHDKDPGPLGKDEVDPTVRQLEQKALAEWWNVHNKQELLEVLKWVRSEGHRLEFVKLRDTMLGIPEADLPLAVLNKYEDKLNSRWRLPPPKDSKEVERRMLVLLHLHDQERKVPPITAWDLGRYINLCIWGYLSGYFSHQEALDLAMPMARRIQKSYDSWADYSRDYLLGRTFWSPEDMREEATFYQSLTHHLLDTTNGYWTKIDWHSSLGEGPADPFPYWESMMYDYYSRRQK
jgi:hypothetical protein